MNLRPQRDSKARSSITAEHDERISRETDTAESITAHDGRALDPRWDPIEAALGEALLRASRNGDRDLTLEIVRELKARRLARESGGSAVVVDLEAERERRR